MHTLFNVKAHVFSSLRPDSGVELFRDLLWCQARRLGVSTARIRITADVNVADGGVDAEVEGTVPEGDVLVAGNTFFQIKTGSSSAPWQAAWVRKELFGPAGKAGADRLGAGVRRCMELDGRYVLVCMGCDPTGEQIEAARRHLTVLLTECGHRKPRVEVWGQTTLLGLLSPYPSLVLRLAGRDDLGLISHRDWRAQDLMTPSLELGDAQRALLQEVRGLVLGEVVRHVRVIGEPGIGKTRLVLEALAPPELSSLVIYIPYAEDFQQSRLLRELTRAGGDYSVILVVDECPPKERASIWSALRAHSDRITLLTIDHCPEYLSDELLRVLPCPPLDEQQITKILLTYIESKSDASRWSRFCDGSPRVAHALGQNLRLNPDDLLKSPATINLWERFVCGYGDPTAPAARQRLMVLRHVALFQRFGFEPPVDTEARFIARLVEQADPQITWARFQEVVQELRQRRILQGRATLLIVPKALHVHLWLGYWEMHGRGFDLHELIRSLPGSLVRWFVAMFPYAHQSDVARQQVETLLGHSGPFADPAFGASKAGCAFLCEFAEAAPGAVVACIERLLGALPRQQLIDFHEGRQHMVWALQKISIWPDWFARSAKLLLRLAETENATNGNYATGVFAGLFSLGFGPLAPTVAPPATRWPILRAALASESPEVRAVVLRACQRALNTHCISKAIGPEYQGLRPTPPLWAPRIWGDLFTAYREALDLLMEAWAKWPETDRPLAASVVTDAANGLIRNRHLSDAILDALERLIEDRTTDHRKPLQVLLACKEPVTATARYGGASCHTKCQSGRRRRTSIPAHRHRTIYSRIWRRSTGNVPGILPGGRNQRSCGDGVKPTRILFIGNSFTHRNDLPGMLVRLAAAGKPPQVVEVERVIANGMSLKAHWNRGSAREAIRTSKWDYVVLQEQSTLPLKNRQRMHESVTLFDKEIRDAGAKTVLYMTWARRHEFHRQTELAEAYVSIGRTLGSIVVPVGTAWRHAMETHPELVLHDRDNSHPNLAGSYLAACVFYASLFVRSPFKVQTIDVDSAQLTNDTAHMLQAAAWEAVCTAREPGTSDRSNEGTRRRTRKRPAG